MCFRLKNSAFSLSLECNRSKKSNYLHERRNSNSPTKKQTCACPKCFPPTAMLTSTPEISPHDPDWTNDMEDTQTDYISVTLVSQEELQFWKFLDPASPLASFYERAKGNRTTQVFITADVCEGRVSNSKKDWTLSASEAMCHLAETK